MRPRRPPAAGFTLVELVMVIALTGALAVFALPRLVDLTALRVRAFADELAAQTMAMHRLALAQRRPVVMTLQSTGVSFAYAAGGTLATLACPAGAATCIAPAGPRTATFNSANSGRTTTSTGAALPVTVTGSDVSLAFQLEAETGLFRALP